MERWVAKLLSLVCIFFVPLICTLMPIKVYDIFVRKGKNGEKVLSCLMCFGGGVFFATYILHMGPEVRRILNAALLDPYNITYPLSELLIAVGFFVVLIMEKSILAIHRRRKERKKQQCNDCPFNMESDPSMEVHFEKGRGRNITVNSLDIEDMAGEHHALNSCHCEDSKTDSVPKSVNCTPSNGKCVSKPPVKRPSMSHHHQHPELLDEEEVENIHVSRSLVLVVALSLHRIFEGMSIGLKHTVSGVGHLLLAVICHETVIGFGLGLQFVGANFPQRKIIIFSTVCSLIMPIGVAIGTIITEGGGQGDSLMLVNGVLQALSTGTFIYVTFFEILQDEITHSDTSATKVISLFVGFAVMALLSAIQEPTEEMIDTIALNTTLTTDLMTKQP